jgi:hypothetical protein
MQVYHPPMPTTLKEYNESLPGCLRCTSHFSASIQHKFGTRHLAALRTEIRLLQALNYTSAENATRFFSLDRVEIVLTSLDFSHCAHQRLNGSKSQIIIEITMEITTFICKAVREGRKFYMLSEQSWKTLRETLCALPRLLCWGYVYPIWFPS